MEEQNPKTSELDTFLDWIRQRREIIPDMSSAGEIAMLYHLDQGKTPFSGQRGFEYIEVACSSAAKMGLLIQTGNFRPTFSSAMPPCLAEPAKPAIGWPDIKRAGALALAFLVGWAVVHYLIGMARASNEVEVDRVEASPVDRKPLHQ